MAGASEQTERVQFVNANWTPGAARADGVFELLVVCESGARDSLPMTASEASAVVALTQAGNVLLFDVESTTLIVANLVGEWIQKTWSAGNRAASYLALAISGIGSFAIFLYLSYFLQQTLAYSALKAGLAFLPFAGALVVGAALAGSALLPRIGPRPLVPLGFLSSAAALVLLTRIDETTRYASGLLPAIVLAGFGLGLIFAAPRTSPRSASPTTSPV